MIRLGPPRPNATAVRAYEFPEMMRSTLSNGLHVIVAPMRRLPIVSVRALVDAGASRDAARTEGTASLTSRALCEGTRRLDGAALTEHFEHLGTQLEADADWDDATTSLTVTPPRLEAAIALLGEVLAQPAFAAREVERLRAERLAEILQQQAEPRSLADDKFAEIVYVAESRYGIPAEGNDETVRRIGVSEVRGFHEQHYAPSATTLVFAGDVTVDVAMRVSESALGAWRGEGPPSISLDDRARSSARRVHIVNRPGAPQTELRLGHRGVSRAHQDYFPIVVMNAILGGLFSSRINLNLRERNAFTYGARSEFDWRRHAGPFMVSTAVKTEVTEAATREIMLEIEKLRSENVSGEELSLATAYLDGVFPIRYETTGAVAEAIARAEVFGLGAAYFTDYRTCVRNVTALDVRRAAETYLHPDELQVLAVGDVSDIRGPLDALGLGPSEVHALHSAV